MRGLGGEVDAEPEEVDLSEVKSEHDYLLFAYDLIGLQLTHFLDDVTHLHNRAPQSFAAAIAASQARRLAGRDRGREGCGARVWRWVTSSRKWVSCEASVRR